LTVSLLVSIGVCLFVVLSVMIVLLAVLGCSIHRLTA
jgi:hypothetical protein